VVVKFSQPVTQHFQNDLPDERDTRSAFPHDLSEVDLGAFERECAEKNSTRFLARVIHEALLVRAGQFRNCCRVLTASSPTGGLYWITGSGLNRLKRLTFSPALTFSILRAVAFGFAAENTALLL
jgi:hypothetical protein